MSYIYKSGSQDPMNFQVLFINVTDGAIESSDNWLTYNGSYGLGNINNWKTDADVTQMEQTFEFTGNAYTNFSALTVPASGSRVGRLTTSTKKSPSIRRQTENFKIDRRLLHK
jgi:hypothetical protein